MNAGFPDEVRPALGLTALGAVETELEALEGVLRLLGCEGEADRLEAVRLAVRVVRLQRAGLAARIPKEVPE
jgi:hypothetical protein